MGLTPKQIHRPIPRPDIALFEGKERRSKILIFLQLIFSLLGAQASPPIDCSKVAPFVPIRFERAQIQAVHLNNSFSTLIDDLICESGIDVPVYDIRGRERDAYYCLKPLKEEILQCKTQMKGEDAEITIVPGIRIRLDQNKVSWKSHYFHAYVYSESKFLLDLFSRQLTQNLKSDPVIIEGSKLLRTPSSNSEGYWVQVRFN